MIWKIVFAFSFVVLKSRASEEGCPPVEDIYPCTCTGLPYNYFICFDIHDTHTLSNIFHRSSGYSYNTVRLENLVLKYLPADLFQGIKVKEFQLVNSTLQQFFDKIPENLQLLDVLSIDSTHFYGGLSWEYLETFTNLRILNIYYSRIPVLDEKFKEYVTKNLQQLTLLEIQEPTIEPGVLAEYKNLDRITIEKCNLSELSRNVFPTPFNGRDLYFRNNKLKNLPVDLFNDMPNLQTVDLRGNMIETIPPSSSLKKADYLLLEGNPIECDCRIYWMMMKHRPVVVTGRCREPEQYRGLLLKNLDYKLFNCPNHEE